MAKKVKRLAWSSEDVRSLKSFAKARMSGPQIAQKLKRTPRAGVIRSAVRYAINATTELFRNHPQNSLLGVICASNIAAG
jgi:hypothetical protein